MGSPQARVCSGCYPARPGLRRVHRPPPSWRSEVLQTGSVPHRQSTEKRIKQTRNTRRGAQARDVYFCMNCSFSMPCCAEWVFARPPHSKTPLGASTANCRGCARRWKAAKACPPKTPLLSFFLWLGIRHTPPSVGLLTASFNLSSAVLPSIHPRKYQGCASGERN